MTPAPDATDAPDAAARAQRDRLRRMRGIATGLLVAMAALLVAARMHEARWPALSWVAAFAEAAMVGALADWFAVVALFRHPLGLPIPHTAIVPRQRDRIGVALGRFVEHHFLAPDNVATELARLEPARLLGRWLGRGENRMRVGALLVPALRRALDALDGEPTRTWLRERLEERLRRVDVAALSARLLELLAAEDREQRWLDQGLERALALLLEHGDWVRARIREHLGWLGRALSIDERAHDKLVEALQDTLGQISADPDHPLRHEFRDLVARLITELRTSEAWRARGRALLVELIERPAVRARLDRVWDTVGDELRRQADDPASPLRRRIDDALADLAHRLDRDPALRTRVDGWLRGALLALVSAHRGRIAALVPATVRRWDAPTLAARLELLVGPDLQYVRISGTLVGGLCGLAIAAVSRAFGG